MPKPASSKKSDQKPSKKRLPEKQEKPLKDTKVKHAPPVASKDLIVKAEVNFGVVCNFNLFPESSSSELRADSQPLKAPAHETKTKIKVTSPYFSCTLYVYPTLLKSATSKKNSPAKPATSVKNQKVENHRLVHLVSHPLPRPRGNSPVTSRAGATIP